LGARPQSLLFACSQNAVRSPMAEAMARFMFGSEMRVESAGARAGAPDGFAMAVMNEKGLDITRHEPKSFEELEFTHFELVVALSSEAERRARDFFRASATVVEFWPTEDATHFEGAREQKLEAYRAVRDGLLLRIKQRFFGPPIGYR
jgi:protein-tyrosine-phosphatase